MLEKEMMARHRPSLLDWRALIIALTTRGCGYKTVPSQAVAKRHLKGDRWFSAQLSSWLKEESPSTVLYMRKDVDYEIGGKEAEGSFPWEEEREISPSPLEWGSSILKT
ncbi:UNVERIFIED_CONTAM: hypothetical protein Sindi_2137100 [Sesamum indicum]